MKEQITGRTFAHDFEKTLSETVPVSWVFTSPSTALLLNILRLK